MLILDEILVNALPLKIVRDDLFPAVGGGNKARKAVFYEDELKRGGFNAVVTTGGIQSNHNRAIALMCARNGWKCHIVYHGTMERFEAEKGNALLVRFSGATYEFTDVSEISVAMARAMERLRKDGYYPYYVTGGGHDLPGGLAFVDAVKTLKRECDMKGYKPDYIFHASGTGSTQAGILVGLDRVGWRDVKVVGISVARQKERGTKVIEEFANKLARTCRLNKDYSGLVNFNEDYLCGGYECYTPEMKEYLEMTTRHTGLIFDTTYSGKAFWGMMQQVKHSGLQDKKILFWHTGGIMNIME